MLDSLLETIKSASALRSPAALAPTVPGARVMPPTFPSQEKGKANEYLMETRVAADGSQTHAVVLDTVTSSANRVEEALFDAIEEGELSIADLRIRVGDFGELSTLQLPHRVFDAYLLEGLLDREPFPKTELGRSLSRSTIRDATALFLHSPTSLLFGAWDSHGDRGGLGSRFARVLAIESIGFGAVEGERAAQKTDPLIPGRGDITLYQGSDARFTLDEGKAKGDGKKAESIEMSELGFGAVPARQHGGVTLERAEQQVVLSLGQLRRLRFPLNGKHDPAVSQAARVVLAALGILGVELQRDRGFSLRSGCELTLEKEPVWERVGRTLEDVETFEVGGSAGARELFDAAVEHAASLGLAWADPITLEGRDELVELVRRTREANG